MPPQSPKNSNLFSLVAGEWVGKSLFSHSQGTLLHACNQRHGNGNSRHVLDVSHTLKERPNLMPRARMPES